MSRFDGFDVADGDVIPPGVWDYRLRLALGSKRGRKALEALGAALLAMPEKRLVTDVLVGHGGECCAIGALLIARQMREDHTDWATAADHLSWHGESTPYETALIGQGCGMAYTLAWEVAERNDEQFVHSGPEGRYEGMLAWVRRTLGIFHPDEADIATTATSGH